MELKSKKKRTPSREKILASVAYGLLRLDSQQAALQSVLVAELVRIGADEDRLKDAIGEMTKRNLQNRLEEIENQSPRLAASMDSRKQSDLPDEFFS